MFQNIDQSADDNVRDTVLSDLSFNPVDIDALIGWRAQPAPVVWAVILELKIAELVTWHYGNRVAHIALQ